MQPLSPRRARHAPAHQHDGAPCLEHHAADHSSAETGAPAAREEPPAPSGTVPHLTAQQLAVLRLTQQGMTIDQIGLVLGLASRTVHRRVFEARIALGVATRAESVAKARELGMLDPSPYPVDWMRDRDRSGSWDHRLYLAAFDRHLAADDDEDRLERIKALTDAALESIGARPGGSVAARDWMTERLLEDMAKVS
jgi:DNA-binding CsgD family transcriptional regulator